MIQKLYTYRLWIVVVFALFFSEGVTAQFDIPEKPELKDQTAVYDYINLLPLSQKTALSEKLVNYADTTSTQIVIAVISTTQGEDISLLGAKWGQKWGVGQAEEDNGIFIILAKDDRNIDINTGYGIEYRMSDRTTEQIINRIIVPQFKQGNFYGGLDQGTDAIFDALNGEFKEDRDFSESDFPMEIIIPLIFLIIFIILRIRNRHDGHGGGGSLLDVIILSNMGRTGGYGGSSSSGGGWSSGSGGGWSGGSSGGFGGGFGGGGFGGGGASGSW